MIVNPDAEAESAYRKLQREFVHLKDVLAENRDLPAVTADGTAIELLANINSVDDARTAARDGGRRRGAVSHGVFVPHASQRAGRGGAIEPPIAPIIEASPNSRVTIRTLDLGGDKTIPYLGHDREANPFLGWRSIRLSFEHPQFFTTQIRAIVRSAAAGQARHRPMCGSCSP